MENEIAAQKFGKFEIIEKLGQGGMGTVFKAKDPAIGRMVALKTLNPELLSDPKLLDRFAKEARAAGQLDHENIIRIYDFDSGETSGQPFIAMEFIEGESLEKAIARRAPMPLARKLQIIMQFCRGLDYAHRHGLVHRDVKPANILVKSDGKVKVVDFGIVHMESTTMTKTGIFMGTIQYASPEQVDGQRVDARSDIFSVGIVMYEFLAYRKPFDGTTIGAVINQILNKDAISLGQVVEGIPPELESAVNKCLRKSVDDRYQSLDDLVIDLEPVELALQHTLVEEMLGQGQALLGRGDLSQAQEILRNALVLDSANSTARELMSRVKAAIKKAESSSHVRQHLTEGEVHLKQGEFTEAVRSFEQVLKLDSQHGQARELIERARREEERKTELNKAIIAGKNALQEGDLTRAEVQLRHALELDPHHLVAKKHLEDITRERAAREKRLRQNELVWEANNMVTQERYLEAVEFIERALVEFPEDQELTALAETARRGLEKRRFLDSEAERVQTMLWKGDLRQAVEQAENLCIVYPQESQFTQLYEDAKSKQEAAERERRFGEELAAIQQLIESGRFDAAIQRSGRLQREFPERTEVESLVSRAQSERDQTEKRNLAALYQDVQELVNSGRFQEAIRKAEAAWRASPGSPEIETLLANVNTAFEEEKKKQAAREREDKKRREAEARAATEVREREAKKSTAEQRLEEEARRAGAQRQLQEQLKKRKPPAREERHPAEAPPPPPGPRDFPMSAPGAPGAQPAAPPSGAEAQTAATLPTPAPPAPAEKPVPPKTTPPPVQEPPETRAAGPVSVPTPTVEPPPPAPPRPRPAVEPARAKAVPVPVVAAKPAASKMPMIAGAAAVVLIVVGIVVWKMMPHAPAPGPNGGGPAAPTASAEQIQLRDAAQTLEGQHQLQQALDEWNKLAQESSPLHDDAKAAVARVQARMDEAKSDMKSGQNALNAMKYDQAEADYRKAQQIDAGQKAEAENGIQSAEDGKKGLSADQAEQNAFTRAKALMRNRDYLGAQAAFKSVVDKNLPNSKLVPQAKTQLSNLDALVQQQRRFDDAVNRFKAKDNAGAKPIFQELVTQNTPWKTDAQSYLDKIRQQDEEAKTAATQQARQEAQKLKAQKLDAANADFDGKLNSGKYSDAEAAIPNVVSAGGSQAELQNKVRNKYNGELNDLKAQAGDAAGDAKALGSVREKVSELAGRAGSPLGQTASDFKGKLEAEIAKLNPPPTPKQAPPAPTPTPTAPGPTPALHAVVSLVPQEHRPLTGAFNSSLLYQLGVLDPGFNLESGPDVSGKNIPSGTTVSMTLQISSDGSVDKLLRCFSGGQQWCQASASAPGWKFSSPTVNGHPAKAEVWVRVAVK